MSQDKKISDEELENQVRQGKKIKQIAYDFGYGWPSRTLSERVKDFGYESNDSVTLQDYGGGVFSLDSDTVEAATELASVEPVQKDGTEKLFKHNEVVERPDEFELEKGDVVVRLHESAWRKVEGDDSE